MVYDEYAPSHLDAKQASDAAVRRERHCGIKNCMCLHDGVCFKGWIDNDRGVAVPCAICRGDLAEALARMPKPGERTESDWAEFRNRGKAD